MDGDWGGPLAQADFAGSGVGFFGADAIEDLVHLPFFFFLLILQRDTKKKTRNETNELLYN